MLLHTGSEFTLPDVAPKKARPNRAEEDDGGNNLDAYSSSDSGQQATVQCLLGERQLLTQSQGNISVVDRTAHAVWEDGLRSGQGTVELGSGVWEGDYSFKSRFRDTGVKSNPEELISAGLASCISMAVANALEGAASTPHTVRTTVNCPMELDRDMGPTISEIEVTTEIAIEGHDSHRVTRIATQAQQSCPVSRLLDTNKISFTVEHVD